VIFRSRPGDGWLGLCSVLGNDLSRKSRVFTQMYRHERERECLQDALNSTRHCPREGRTGTRMIRVSTSAENSVSTVSTVSVARVGSRADLAGVKE
jgi:hypothetical protein